MHEDVHHRARKQQQKRPSPQDVCPVLAQEQERRDGQKCQTDKECPRRPETALRRGRIVVRMITGRHVGLQLCLPEFCINRRFVMREEIAGILALSATT
jgi:hypothetical protein